MMANARKGLWTALKYFLLIVVGFFMIYPLVWMLGATFKPNNEIFTGIGFLAKKPTLSGYINAMNNYGGDINLFLSMFNTYSYVVPKVIFTAGSTLLTAYGFSRFKFFGGGLLFSLMIGTLFLPQVVLNVPQYLLFNQFGWINSKLYLPMIVPTLFAVDTFFVFMMVQFMRSIPRELDEAAMIDGCSSFQILSRIIAPTMKPALASCALFQFMWSSNDFMGPLLYVKTPSKYPAALFVKLSMDADAGFEWNRVLAVSLISIIPSLVVFFFAQKQFVEGITAGGVKG
jgi:oligogalacturonide transport system permease protein